MKYTKPVKSNLTVSRICMGCMGFGATGEGQHSWTLDAENIALTPCSALACGRLSRKPGEDSRRL